MIQTGIASDDVIQVTEGLEEGEQVIPDLGGYSEGDRVQAAVAESQTEDGGQ